MKYVLFIFSLCMLSLLGCAQSVNLLATPVNAPAGSLLYVGSNGFLIPLTPPASTTPLILTYSGGIYSFIAMPAAQKGDKGDKGDTGAQGLQGVPGPQGASGSGASLPSANEGEVLAFINGGWQGTPATFNIDVTDSTTTHAITLANVSATRGGAYWIGGYINLLNTDHSGGVSLQYSFTDINGKLITKSFPIMTEIGNSQFNPVIINCKANTIITVSTILSNPDMGISYNVGDVIHELR